MDQHSFIPRWFRALFVVTMLLISLLLFWYAPLQVNLHFQLEDLALSLDTSRQREAKQQYEYDQVAAQLPITQAELALLQPQADDAAARETELRTQRKTLRTQQADITQQLEAAQTAIAALTSEVSSLQAETDALRAQEITLLQQVEALLIQSSYAP